jgi:isocitrate dehydrogenase
VLREGNSDRRVAAPVKEYARAHPHSMGAWSGDSKTHVAHMHGDDFYGNEQSVVVGQTGTLRIELTDQQGETTVLKPSVAVAAGDVIGATVMRCGALREFYDSAIDDAKAKAFCCRCTSRRR